MKKTSTNFLLIPKKSFTLIEMLIVVVIIGVLVGLALPQYVNVTEKAKAAEVYPIFAHFRYGFKARLLEGLQVDRTLIWSDPDYWNPNWNAGSTPDWTAVGMDNPNANPQRNFAYDYWGADWSSTHAPVNAPRNILIAHRKINLVAYPTGADIDMSRYIYIDCDTGEIFKTPPY